ncbi:unnamed protein product [Protopolystoma xenopodis]|uniref:Uncharacterized protein n=1 Tax=Protopolystoma xenopodis TaxID=117903 RepID=A0A448WY69_9PLAT|nr:unnamed protein product [Protopolystoma xenopodis]
MKFVDGHSVRDRRLAAKRQVEQLNADLRDKTALLASLEQAGQEGEEAYISLLTKYDSQVVDLKERINALEKEKLSLAAELSKAVNVKTKSKLAEKERELSEARRQLSELSRLKRAKEAREAECLRLQQEIQACKLSMVRSIRQLNSETKAYHKWKLDKEKEAS